MRKLIKFNDFLYKIEENMNESKLDLKNLRVKEVELVFSERMIKTLKEMDHQIADDLLDTYYDKEELEPKFKVTFVDLGSEPGKVTYLSANKVPPLVEPEIVHGDYHREEPGTDELGNKKFKGGHYDYVSSYKNPWISDLGNLVTLYDDQFKDKTHPVWKDSTRVEKKANQFVNVIFGNKKYPHNYKREEAAKMDKLDDLESFQHMFTAIVEANSKIIKQVEGKEITHFYNKENYFINANTMASSCMNDSHKAPYLKMYEINPNNVKMLVLFPEDERKKIIGRALLWSLPNGRQFMDRVYTSKDTDEFMFIEYAKSKGYYYKSSQTYGHNYELIDGKNGNREKLNIEIQLENTDFDQYPYTDTLQFYNTETGVITNNRNIVRSGENWLLLTHTDGTGSEQ